MRIINLFEMIDVDHDERHGEADPLRVAEFLFEAVQKIALIENAGDGIQNRHFVELLVKNIFEIVLISKFENGAGRDLDFVAVF